MKMQMDTSLDMLSVDERRLFAEILKASKTVICGGTEFKIVANPGVIARELRLEKSYEKLKSTVHLRPIGRKERTYLSLVFRSQEEFSFWAERARELSARILEAYEEDRLEVAGRALEAYEAARGLVGHSVARPDAEMQAVEGKTKDTEIFWGSSPAMKVIADVVFSLPNNVTVLLTGETGVGKDTIARAIHSLGDRCDNPFLNINCTAMPDELIESELFGHENGAFTGAVARHIGAFERASSGTILLNEIGDLPPMLQAKLLHVLDDGEFYRVGGEKMVKTDARIIAATNADLASKMQSGTFRADLYWRLNVVNIRVPSLRERSDDIGQFFSMLLVRECKRLGVAVPEVGAEIRNFLLTYGWPGNIRELENFCKRVALWGGNPEQVLGGMHARADVPAENQEIPYTAEYAGDEVKRLKDTIRAAVISAEIPVIKKALERTGWNRRKAARLLKISYWALLYKIKDYGLSEEM